MNKIRKIYLYIAVGLIFLANYLDGIADSLSLVLSGLLLILSVLTSRKILLRKKAIVILFILFLHSIITYYVFDESYTYAIKQIVGITIMFLLYDNICMGFSVSYIFKVYIQYCLILVYYGLLQEILFIFGNGFLIKTEWMRISYINLLGKLFLLRINSFQGEPAAVGILLIPLIGLIFFQISGYRIDNIHINIINIILIILCLLFTFSTLAYLCILMIAILKFFTEINLKKMESTKIFFTLFTALILFICSYVIYNNVPGIAIRIKGLIGLIANGFIGSAGLSVYAIYSNILVCIKSFAITNGFGGGIGSYPELYNICAKYVLDSNYIGFGINSEDGCSLAIRICAELGIGGIIGVILFIKKNYVKLNVEYQINYIISVCVLGHFFAKFFRQAHYWGLGTIFFVVLYMVNKSEYSNKQSSEKLSQC